MIRRTVLQTERDPRALKWSLIAAAFALSVGSYADMVISTEAEAEPVSSTFVGEAPQPEQPPVTIAG